jgi:hypothetical protein
VEREETSPRAGQAGQQADQETTGD